MGINTLKTPEELLPDGYLLEDHSDPWIPDQRLPLEEALFGSGLTAEPLRQARIKIAKLKNIK